MIATPASLQDSTLHMHPKTSVNLPCNAPCAREIAAREPAPEM